MEEEADERRLVLLDSWNVVRLVLSFSALGFDLVNFINYARNIVIRIFRIMFSNFQVLSVDLLSFIYESLNESSFLPAQQVILVAS